MTRTFQIVGLIRFESLVKRMAKAQKRGDIAAFIKLYFKANQAGKAIKVISF